MRHLISLLILLVLVCAPARAAVLHFAYGQTIEAESCTVEGNTLHYVIPAGVKRLEGTTSLDRVVRVVENDGTGRTFDGNVVSVQAAEQPLALGSAPTDFIDRFNTTAKNYGDCDVELQFQKKIAAKDSGYVYTYLSGEHLAVIMTANEKDMLKGALLISQSDGSVESGLCVLAAVITFLDSIDPSFEPDSRRAALESFGLLEDPIKEKGTFSRNGVKYTYAVSKKLGLTLAADPE